MIRLLAGVAVAALAATPPAPPAPPAPAGAPKPTAETPVRAAPVARFPGFAAALAERPLAAAPSPWAGPPLDSAWATLATGGPSRRQAARWDIALAELRQDRASEAFGVLELMLRDDPDLDLVPAWRRARGAALEMLGRHGDALMALAQDDLAADPETCLWKMRALAGAGRDADALAALRCGLPALTARTRDDRRPFLLAAGEAALDLHRTASLQTWLTNLRDGDPAANLLRGRAAIQAGALQEARHRLERVLISGTPEEQASARLGLIEMAMAGGTITPAEAMKRLDALRFSWRGGAVERRTLLKMRDIALASHDLPHALAAGAALFRYVDMGPDTAPLVSSLERDLAAALAPESGLRLDVAAGLFWDYRDLAPSGAQGDKLVETLVGRLQDAGLYARAADLLQHRLDLAAQDIERGPLSVRIASLRILSGAPDQAVRVLRATAETPFPPEMRADRQQIEAAALQLLGRRAEALAVLDDTPNAQGLRAEILWRARDWSRLIAAETPLLPRPGALSEVGQAIVLRHAIALAMTNREPELAALRARYGVAFAKLPSAESFAALTGNPGHIDPERLSKALAALPSASPAGAMGDLLEAGTAALRPDRTG